MSKQELLLSKEVRQRPQSLFKNKNTAVNIVTPAPAAISKDLRRQHFISLSTRVSEDIFQAQMNEITPAIKILRADIIPALLHGLSRRPISPHHLALGKHCSSREEEEATWAVWSKISRQVQNLPKTFSLLMSVTVCPKFWKYWVRRNISSRFV
jgi:hypothetical protein